jgi:hypothetical protein
MQKHVWLTGRDRENTVKRTEMKLTNNGKNGTIIELKKENAPVAEAR